MHFAILDSCMSFVMKVYVLDFHPTKHFIDTPNV